MNKLHLVDTSDDDRELPLVAGLDDDVAHIEKWGWRDWLLLAFFAVMIGYGAVSMAPT